MRMRIPINKSINFHIIVDEKKEPINIIIVVIIFNNIIYILFDLLKYSRHDSP